MSLRAPRVLLLGLAPLALAIACGERSTSTSTGPAHTGDGVGTVRSDLVSNNEAYTGRDLGDKELALTFDDGPAPLGVTGHLAELLAKHDPPIRATFFVNGAHIASTSLPNPNDLEVEGDAQASLAAIRAHGHLVGNHSTTHRDFGTNEVAANQRVKELADTDDQIARYNDKTWLFFRAPYGSWSQASYNTLKDSAMGKYVGPIYWNIGDVTNANQAADWECWQSFHYTTKQCGDLYLKEIRAKKKGIVLMHDPYGNTNNHNLTSGTGNTVDMVVYVLEQLDAEGGWTFKALDEVPSIRAALPACDDACATCFGPTAESCATCKGGAFPRDGACVACAACEPGTYAATACAGTDTVCEACDASCETCSGAGPGACLTCAGGAASDDGSCGGGSPSTSGAGASSGNVAGPGGASGASGSGSGGGAGSNGGAGDPSASPSADGGDSGCAIVTPSSHTAPGRSLAALGTALAVAAGAVVRRRPRRR